MAETKFTPGPWKVCVGNQGSIFGDLNNPAHDGDNPYIGTVAGISVRENIPVCNANARLIAHAPEMFDMLVLCCLKMQDYENYKMAKKIEALLIKINS